MGNTVLNEVNDPVVENFDIVEYECEIIKLRPETVEADSSFGNFLDKIDGWARHALASSGFGDY